MTNGIKQLSETDHSDERVEKQNCCIHPFRREVRGYGMYIEYFFIQLLSFEHAPSFQHDCCHFRRFSCTSMYTYSCSYIALLNGDLHDILLTVTWELKSLDNFYSLGITQLNWTFLAIIDCIFLRYAAKRSVQAKQS